MSQMLYWCKSLLYLDISEIFYKCGSLNDLDLSNSNTKKDSNMNHHIFYEFTNLIDLHFSYTDIDKKQ